jgi:hypothetical protein
MIRRIRMERNVAARVVGLCVGALIVKKLVAGVQSSTNSYLQISDEELSYLSTILGTRNHNMRLCLKWPGALELASLVSLALGDVGSLPVNALPSDVLDVVQETLDILSQALPVDITVEVPLDWSNVQNNILHGNLDLIIASRLHSLLQMCISETSPFPDEVRRNCLGMCLKSLWYCAKSYHRLGASETLPSYFLGILAIPEITRHIQTGTDPVSRVIGRCFGALVISKLVVSIKSRTDSTVQISDEELGCLSTILGSAGHDVKIWLRLPGTVALANMASLTFNEVDTLISGTGLSDMRDIIHQTLDVLSQSLSAELNAESRLDQTDTLITRSHGQFGRFVVSRLYDLFETCTRQIPRLTEETRTTCLRMCLRSLWDCGRAYHQLGASELLPSYIPLTVGGPQMLRRIHSEQDPAVRLIGRCFEALIANNLADRVKSLSDPTVLIRDKALECLSTILGADDDDMVLWLGCPGAIELVNMVSLIFSEINSLFFDTIPSDVLDMVQKTFIILTQSLPTELEAELWSDKTETLMSLTEG